MDQGFRSADDGIMKFVIEAIFVKVFLECCVREVRAVPSEEVIHPVQNRETEM